jgi:hypothetical protein
MKAVVFIWEMFWGIILIPVFVLGYICGAIRNAFVKGVRSL